MKVIDLKMQQQLEEAIKKSGSGEQLMLSQDSRQNIEKELKLWEEKLKKCGSKEEVWQLMEDFEEEIRLAAFSIENNPAVPLEKKLECTVMKDTKLSMIEEMVERYSKTSAYEQLPEQAEGADEPEVLNEENASLEQEEPSEEQRIRYARAKANYEGLKQSHKEDGQEGFQPPTSFEAKG